MARSTPVQTKTFAWIVLAVGAASAVTLVLALRAHGRASRAAQSRADAEVHLAALRERVSGLERQLELLQQALEGMQARAADGADAEREPATPTPGISSPDLVAVLAERLDRLERLVADLAQVAPDDWRWPGGDAAEIRALLAELERQRDDFPHIDWLSSLDDALSLDAVRRLQDLASDRSAAPEARVEALNALNEAAGRLGMDLLDAATAAVAIELAAGSDLAEIRRGVYSALEGKTYPALRGPISAAAREDPSPEVRDDAVAALGHFLPDAEIEERLRWIRDNDPDAGVRDEAAEALAKHAQD